MESYVERAQNDYRVTVKVRNERLIDAIKRAGFEPGGKFAAAVGVSYAQLNDLINMTASPLYKNGELRPITEALMLYLNASLHDLFNDQQINDPVESNYTEFVLDDFELERLCADDPQDSLIEQETSERISGAISSLSDRERFVIARRYGFDGKQMTLDEIGALMGVGRERVRQIEAKALRRLRAKRVLEFIEGDVSDHGYRQ